MGTIGMNQTALITGASGGIGYELAKLFANDHHNLVLVARTTSKLTQFADELQRQFGISAKSVRLDLTAATAPQFLFEQLQREGIAVDVLVNNAGYGVLGEFAKVSLQDTLGQIQLNVATLTHLTKLFLGPMIERHSGKIMNVASTANELDGTGVTVTCLCPGATDTGFQGRAGMENTMLFKKLRPMDAKTVARDGYRALIAGKPLVISGFRNWLLAKSVRFSPRGLVTAISRKVLDKAE
jgi:short-subunit dehydrogenase